MDKEQKVYQWLQSSDTELSSECVAFTYLTKGKSLTSNFPNTIDDIQCCMRLFEKCPFIKIKIMKKVSKGWKCFADNWDDLTKIITEMQTSKTPKERGSKFNAAGRIIEACKWHSGEYVHYMKPDRLLKIKGV